MKMKNKFIIIIVLFFSMFSISYSADYPYDVQNAIYSTRNLSVGSEDSVPRSMSFNNDGSKVFMIGSTNTRIFEYDCSTNYKIDTCSYSTRNLSVGSEESAPRDIVFNNNGSKVFIIGITNTRIFEYDCSTNYKIDTCSYSTRNLSVGSENIFPQGIVFNNNGSKVFMIGSESFNTRIFEYDCSTNYKIDTCSYSTRNLNVAPQESAPQGMSFNNNGSKVFIIGSTPSTIFEYDCSTNFKIDTCIYSTRSLSVGSEDAIPQGMSFNNNGSKVFMIGTFNDRIYEYDIIIDSCTPPVINNDWIIDSTDNCDIQNQIIELGTGGIFYTNSGSITFTNVNLTSSFFERQGGVDTVADYPYDVQNAIYSGLNLNVAPQESAPRDIVFNNNGSKVFMIGTNTDSIYEYDCSTNFKIDTCIYSTRNLSVGSEDSAPQGMSFNNNGSKVFIIGTNTDSIYEYDCSTNFKIDTCSYSTRNLSVGSEELSPQGISFNNNGSKVFIIGVNTDRIFEYDCSTNFKIDTCSYSTRNLNVGSEDTSPRSMSFNNDGSKVFIIGTTNDRFFEYDCSTNFKIDTCIYSTRNLSVGSEDSSPQGMSFNNDGSKVFMIGTTNDRIFEYDIDFPIDINTQIYLYSTMCTLI